MNVKINLRYSIELDQEIVTYAWVQNCHVCKTPTRFNKKLMLQPDCDEERAREIVKRAHPVYEERVCSSECEYMRELNPLAYEIHTTN